MSYNIAKLSTDEFNFVRSLGVEIFLRSTDEVRKIIEDGYNDSLDSGYTGLDGRADFHFWMKKVLKDSNFVNGVELEATESDDKR